jgi:hypothetical protein
MTTNNTRISEVEWAMGMLSELRDAVADDDHDAADIIRLSLGDCVLRMTTDEFVEYIERLL